MASTLVYLTVNDPDVTFGCTLTAGDATYDEVSTADDRNISVGVLPGIYQV